MADLSSVRAKIADALDEADLALGSTSVGQQIADLTTRLANANLALTQAQQLNAALTAQLTAVGSDLDTAATAIGSAKGKLQGSPK